MPEHRSSASDDGQISATIKVRLNRDWIVVGLRPKFSPHCSCQRCDRWWSQCVVPSGAWEFHYACSSKYNVLPRSGASGRDLSDFDRDPIGLRIRSYRDRISIRLRSKFAHIAATSIAPTSSRISIGFRLESRRGPTGGSPLATPSV